MDYWKKWLKAAAVRAIKTMAEAIIILVGSNMVNITELDWKYILGCAATMGIVSICFSLKGLPECEEKENVHYDDEVFADDVKEVLEGDVPNEL